VGGSGVTPRVGRCDSRRLNYEMYIAKQFGTHIHKHELSSTVVGVETNNFLTKIYYLYL
jgi:hypothetical protein